MPKNEPLNTVDTILEWNVTDQNTNGLDQCLSDLRIWHKRVERHINDICVEKHKRAMRK